MTVRWGFLGAGFVASRAMAGAVHAAPGAELHAAAARDPERAAALGAARVHRCYTDLVADPDVDAVYISLANDAHLTWTLAALAAGKHVLCEKPLALTAAEVDTMAAAAAAAERLVVEASWYRWHPRTRRAEELLAAAAIGPLRHISAGFTFTGVPDGNYRLDAAMGGGAAYDVGHYAASAVVWAGDAAGVEWTGAQVSARTRPGVTGVDLRSDVVVELADGVRAELVASFADPPRQWLRLRGEAGELDLEPPAFTAWQAPATLAVGDAASTRREEFPALDAYQLMVTEVSAALAAGGLGGWIVPLRQSRATAALLDAARVSAGSGGRPVAPPPPGPGP